MNIYGQIERYYILATSKSIAPLHQQDVLWVMRGNNLEKLGIGDRVRWFGSDCPTDEEARWSPIMPWLKTAESVRNPNVLFLVAPQGSYLIDHRNWKELPRFLNDLKASLVLANGLHCVYIDAEWKKCTPREDGIDLLQIATFNRVLLILIRICRFPAAQKQGLTKELKAFF